MKKKASYLPYLIIGYVAISVPTLGARLYELEIKDHYSPIIIQEGKENKNIDTKKYLILKDPDIASKHKAPKQIETHIKGKKKAKFASHKTNGLNDIISDSSHIQLKGIEISGRSKRPRVDFYPIPFSPDPIEEELDISFLKQKIPDTNDF